LVDAALYITPSALGKGGQGRQVALDDPEPSEEAVDGAALLRSLSGLLSRYLALPKGAVTAISLWVLHTYLLEAAWVSPILGIVSPEKRCGKTTLLTLLGRLTRKALSASNITPAALFRSVEHFKPTLLIDEADTFMRRSDELRGLINSGHSRNSAFVLRTAGDDHEPRRFSTWCPKAIALIGNLPDTVEDRSILIPMRRKTPDEVVEKIRADRLAEFDAIRRQCARWAADSLAGLKVADPETPEALNDRAADNWRPLLAIADAVGGEWPERARSAARQLSGAVEDRESIRVQLLIDIKEALGDSERIFTDDLLTALHRNEERPWGEWGRSCKPMSAIQLSRQLRYFEIKPHQVKIDGTNKRGFRRVDFEDAWARYIPPSQGATPLLCNDYGAFSGIQGATREIEVAGRNPENVNNGGKGSGVAGQQGGWSEI